MQILSMIFYTAVTLGVLIFIHELGHFLAAKMTGMRVDRFSIGFPPRAFGKKIGDTDYCISWVPLGGYVKIAGMVDESMDTEFLSREPQEWEFRSKPLWARMLVLSAGVIMNILLAIVIFWGIAYTTGKLSKETTTVGYVLPASPAEQAGFVSGDRILAINGTPVKVWEDVDNQVYVENLGNTMAFEVARGDSTIRLTAAARSLQESNEKPFGIVEAYTVTIISSVENRMPAESLGLTSGDTILTIDGKAIGYPDVVTKIKQHRGSAITLTWKRGDRVLSGNTVVTGEGRIGIGIQPTYTGPVKRVQYSLLGAFPEGLKKTGESIYLFYLTVSKIAAGKASIKESFGGPIAIAQLATQSASYGISSFLGFMALLSMSLATINILPFPALDGGHIAMMLFERIFRREIPQRAKIVIQQTGFILLLLLMAFVIYNDISRF
ncbi:MAG TPA: RIP metalloprotease RseP [Bacteroidota bacterium]|nr:RIP metalloprotease RseP [Bacteroidota bacterium]